jgi:hypothetical protein
MGAPSHRARSAAKRYRRLLREAADTADHMMPDDDVLVRLADARRFTDFYGELLFVGGGPAVHNAKWESTATNDATGKNVLAAVIAAALSEAPPA